MRRELTRDQTILIGEGARRVLNDDSVAVAINHVIEDLKEAWELSAPHDHEGREHCYRMRKCVDMLVAKIESLAANGTIEIHKAETRAKDAAGQSPIH